MRNVIAFLVALGIAAAIFWWTRSRDTERARPPAVASGSGSTTTTSTGGSAGAAKRDDVVDTSKVRRLEPEARKRLGEQIAAARARARANATAAGEPFTEDAMKLEDVAAPLKSKLEEALPLLAECYAKREGTLEAMAQMTLTSDPELGTVIDTEAIKDSAGQPLEPSLDTCLRDAIDSLALPPLGPRGGKLPLQYTFKSE